MKSRWFTREADSLSDSSFDSQPTDNDAETDHPGWKVQKSHLQFREKMEECGHHVARTTTRGLFACWQVWFALAGLDSEPQLLQQGVKSLLAEVGKDDWLVWNEFRSTETPRRYGADAMASVVVWTLYSASRFESSDRRVKELQKSILEHPSKPIFDFISSLIHKHLPHNKIALLDEFVVFQLCCLKMNCPRPDYLFRETKVGEAAVRKGISLAKMGLTGLPSTLIHLNDTITFVNALMTSFPSETYRIGEDYTGDISLDLVENRLVYFADSTSQPVMFPDIHWSQECPIDLIDIRSNPSTIVPFSFFHKVIISPTPHKPEQNSHPWFAYWKKMTPKNKAGVPSLRLLAAVKVHELLTRTGRDGEFAQFLDMFRDVRECDYCHELYELTPSEWLGFHIYSVIHADWENSIFSAGNIKAWTCLACHLQVNEDDTKVPT